MSLIAVPAWYISSVYTKQMAPTSLGKCKYHSLLHKHTQANKVIDILLLEISSDIERIFVDNKCDCMNVLKCGLFAQCRLCFVQMPRTIL